MHIRFIVALAALTAATAYSPFVRANCSAAPTCARNASFERPTVRYAQAKNMVVMPLGPGQTPQSIPVSSAAVGPVDDRMTLIASSTITTGLQQLVYPPRCPDADSEKECVPGLTFQWSAPSSFSPSKSNSPIFSTVPSQPGYFVFTLIVEDPKPLPCCFTGRSKWELKIPVIVYKLEIEEIEYTNAYQQFKSDPEPANPNGTRYSPAFKKDRNPPVYPSVFARGDQVQTRIKFDAAPNGLAMYVWGIQPLSLPSAAGIRYPKFGQFITGGQLVFSLDSQNNIPGKVALWNVATAWYADAYPDERRKELIEISNTPAYATLERSPKWKTDTYYETALEIGNNRLNPAPSTINRAEAMREIFKEFEDLDVRKINGSSAMVYWGPVSTGPPPVTANTFTKSGSVHSLLEKQDASCSGWAEFLQMIYEAQGIIQGTDFWTVNIQIMDYNRAQDFVVGTPLTGAELPGQGTPSPGKRVFPQHQLLVTNVGQVSGDQMLSILCPSYGARVDVLVQPGHTVAASGGFTPTGTTNAIVQNQCTALRMAAREYENRFFSHYLVKKSSWGGLRTAVYQVPNLLVVPPLTPTSSPSDIEAFFEGPVGLVVRGVGQLKLPGCP